MDYSSERVVEPFAINTIGNSYDKHHLSFLRGHKNDAFDFTSPDGRVALEVSLIIPGNINRVITYEDRKSKGETCDRSYVRNALYDDAGNLLCYDGGSISELKLLILERITAKNGKALRRKTGTIKSYELCLAIFDGGLLHKPTDFKFVLESKEFNDSIFDKLFIITSGNFFLIENASIREYKRVFLPKGA